MKSIPSTLLILYITAFGLVGGASAVELEPDTTAALEAIQKVVETYESTWNESNMEAWGQLFTDDVDYVHRGGGRWVSNEENVEGHRRIHAHLEERGQPMNLQLTIEDVAFLSPAIALVHVTSRWPGFTVPEAGEDGALGAFITMVLVQVEDDWRIRAFHNTLISNPSP